MGFAAVLRIAALGVLSAMGCGSSGGVAVRPIRATPGEPTVLLRGTITDIAFQNINKARGHYTYNVHLVIQHEGVPGSTGDTEAGEIRVRVHKVYWSHLSDAQQQELAPDGPEHAFHPQRWHGYAVGMNFEQAVSISSPGLAFLADGP